MLPVSGVCKVAMVRIKVDLPAPLGPSSPNIPVPIVRLRFLTALTPLSYSLERFAMVNYITIDYN